MSKHITKESIVTRLSTGGIFVVRHAGKYTADCVQSVRGDCKVFVIPLSDLELWLPRAWKASEESLDVAITKSWDETYRDFYGNQS
jgi:hypothetical protein